MPNTAVILNKLGNHNSFMRSDLKMAMEECGYNATEGITNHMISKLLTEGDISRVGRNRYRVAASQKQYRFSYSEFADKVVGEIISAHPYLDFRIFELTQLNEFVVHQIAHNIVFIYVESDLEGDVFNTLWEKHKGAVLLKPDADTLFRYMAEDMVVILKLPTESPKGMDVFWSTRLEKMLVDIAVDKLLKKVVYSGEYPMIYQDAFRKYAVDRNTMARYARRRGALKKYRDFLVNEAGLDQEDIGI